MYKIKQIFTGIFISTLLCSNIAVAEDTIMKFDGVVTLPSSITDLLASCEGEECPSISINVRQKFGTYLSYSSSVDHNDSSGQYEYRTEWIQDESAGTDEDNNYSVTIYIHNGNMGEWEELFYDFGSDHQIGTTAGEDSNDSILHQDEVEFICIENWCGFDTQDLNLPLDQTDTQLNIDISNKDEGRQKVTGKFRLPDGISLGEQSDENGTFYNQMGVVIQDTSYSIWLFQSASSNLDADGNYTWTTSFKYDYAVGSQLVLQVQGELDRHQIVASYQIGEDENDMDDHSIDGDEKLVTRYLDTNTNYAEFTGAVADFQVIDVATYLEGAKVLSGLFVPPETFPPVNENDEQRGIYLGFYSQSEDFWFNTGVNIDGYNSTPSDDGSYSYELLLPQDIQGHIEENNLSHTIDYNYNNMATGEYKHWHNTYSFGADNQVGGTGDNEDHILGVCEDMWSAMPLVIDFAADLPVIDVNLSDYVLPNTSTVTATLEVPSQIENVWFWATDMTCGVEKNIHLGGWTNNDGIYTDVEIQGLIEGREYAINIGYNEAGNFDNWYRYVLNNENLDLTTEGVYLDEITWDEETGQDVYPDPLAVVTGTDGVDTVISPFEFILPPKTAVSPAVIMYLLN